MGRWGRDWGGYYPPSRPRKAKGGIKAQSKRGEFGANWWAKRWNEVIERFDIGARLDRGRRYARQGQVLGIDIGKGLVVARVQGSRPKPYEVAIQVRQLGPAEWQAVADALATQAIHVAKLLAGEMPASIEEVFTEAGVALFPGRLGDLTTKCSCPDMSNPCKHIAAVYYLLGEEFDRDPFLIFTLRGCTREELLARLDDPESLAAQAVRPREPLAAPEPLPTDAVLFWGAASGATDEPGEEVVVPPVVAALPRRLGAFPFWRGRQSFLDAITPSYARASARALDVILAAAPAAPTAEDQARISETTRPATSVRRKSRPL